MAVNIQCETICQFASIYCVRSILLNNEPKKVPDSKDTEHSSRPNSKRFISSVARHDCISNILRFLVKRKLFPHRDDLDIFVIVVFVGFLNCLFVVVLLFCCYCCVFFSFSPLFCCVRLIFYAVNEHY